MKYILLICTLFISACSTTVPIRQDFPDAPTVLLEKCVNLHKASDTETDITNLLKVVINNYSLYYECAERQNGWIEWYAKQQQIFNGINK